MIKKFLYWLVLGFVMPATSFAGIDLYCRPLATYFLRHWETPIATYCRKERMRYHN